MTVFGVNPRRLGGVEVYARELSIQLHESGWRSVLCFLKKPAPFVEDYLQLPNVRLEVLPEVWRNSWQTVNNLTHLLNRHRPEVLHFQFTPNLSVYPWVARYAGVKSVLFTDQMSYPDPESEPGLGRWKGLVRHAACRPVDMMIAISDHNRRRLERSQLASSDRIYRVYNGVDLTRRAPAGAAREFRQRFNIPSHRLLVTQVASVIPDKGPLMLLEAAAQAKERCDVHVVFAGDGTHLDEYRRIAESMGIRDRVTWTGLLEDPVQSGLYAAADAFCLCSQWQEGFGWVLAEAMAARLPVMATRVGGIPEVVQDGVTGVLFDRTDTKALTQAIVRLAHHPEERTRMGEAGRRRCELLFDVRQTVRQTLDLFGVPRPAASRAVSAS